MIKHLCLAFAVLLSDCHATPEVYQLNSPSTHFGAVPHYDLLKRELLYVDLFAKGNESAIIRYSELRNEFFAARVIGIRGYPGFLIPIECQPNRFLFGFERTGTILNWDGCSDYAYIRDTDNLFTVEIGDEYKTNNLNNGKISPGGELFTASKRSDLCKATPAVNGSLYEYSLQRNIKTVFQPMLAPNGMAWNEEDGLFYLVDSCPKTIREFRYNKRTGALSHERIVIDYTKINSSYFPHGMDIDEDGNLWLVLYKSGEIHKIQSSSGKILQKIKIPQTINVLDATFGGENCDSLFVTTGDMQTDANPVSPGSGKLYVVKKVGARGRYCSAKKFRFTLGKNKEYGCY